MGMVHMLLQKTPTNEPTLKENDLVLHKKNPNTIF